MPTPNTTLDKRRHDIVGLFLIYIATVGDIERTALAANVDPEVVRKLVLAEEWDKKIKSITLASKSGGLQADEFARIQNRAVTWCQGHRLRQILDRAIRVVEEQTDEEFVAGITTTDKEGNSRLNARFFSDLAKSIETVNGMCAFALADTVPEREAASPDEKANTAAIHASLLNALNNPNIRAKPSDTLVEEVAKALEIEEKTATNCPTLEAEIVPPTERKSLALPLVGDNPQIG